MLRLKTTVGSMNVIELNCPQYFALTMSCDDFVVQGIKAKTLLIAIYKEHHTLLVDHNEYVVFTVLPCIPRSVQFAPRLFLSSHFLVVVTQESKATAVIIAAPKGQDVTLINCKDQECTWPLSIPATMISYQAGQDIQVSKLACCRLLFSMQILALQHGKLWAHQKALFVGSGGGIISWRCLLVSHDNFLRWQSTQWLYLLCNA